MPRTDGAGLAAELDCERALGEVDSDGAAAWTRPGELSPVDGDHAGRADAALKSTVRQHVAVFARAARRRQRRGHPPRQARRRRARDRARRRRHRSRPGRSTTRPPIAELELLLGALPARRRLMFEPLAHTVLRIGEAIELSWGRDLVLGECPHIRLRWQWADGRVCEPNTHYGKRDIPSVTGVTRKATRRLAATADSSSRPPPTGGSTATTSTATSSAPPNSRRPRLGHVPQLPPHLRSAARRTAARQGTGIPACAIRVRACAGSRDSRTARPGVTGLPSVSAGNR
jgi:hypothetical protein